MIQTDLMLPARRACALVPNVLIVIAALAVLCLPPGAVGQNPPPPRIDLGSLGGSSVGMRVNSAGQVAGVAYTGVGVYHGFFWSTTAGMLDLGTLGGATSAIQAINAAGQIVGYSYVAGNTATHAFVWDSTGGMRDLGTLPGGHNSQAVALNDVGQVVGWSDGSGGGHAFIWDSVNGMRDLGALSGYPYSLAAAINANGQVVGQSTDGTSGGHRAFIWDSTNGMQSLGTLSGASWATGINDSAQVIGLTDGGARAFIWDSEHGMQDLGTLGGPNSYPRAINDAGQVVGDSQTTEFIPPSSTDDGGYVHHAFLWDAVQGMQDIGNSDGQPNATSIGQGINNAGQILVNSAGSFVLDPTRGIRYLGFGSTGGFAGDINASAQVTGFYFPPNGNPQQMAFLISLDGFAPVITGLSPNSVGSGSGDLALTIQGFGFDVSTVVLWNNQPLNVSSFTASNLTLTVPASLLQTTLDFQTVPVTTKSASGLVSNAKGFTLISNPANVAALQSGVVTSNTPGTVAIPPSPTDASGISATLSVTGQETAAVSVAIYNGDPSASGNTSFDAAGSYMDLNVSGVSQSDSLTAYFYFPPGTDLSVPVLKFWNTQLSPAAWDWVSPTIAEPDLNRIAVTFNSTSIPTITQLNGSFFVLAREQLQFTGFLSPIGGADATGGSPASPLRTFKMGSTVPVKFTANYRTGAPVVTGVHTLQLIHYSDATTSGTPIDATPQDAATRGNQFRLADGQWVFNLDTKATGMSVGIWELVATLADRSQHTAWLQLK